MYIYHTDSIHLPTQLSLNFSLHVSIVSKLNFSTVMWIVGTPFLCSNKNSFIVRTNTRTVSHKQQNMRMIVQKGHVLIFTIFCYGGISEKSDNIPRNVCVVCETYLCWCDRQTYGQTDGQTTDKVIPMCRYDSQATQLKVPIQINAFCSFRCNITSLLDLLPENHLY